MQPVWEAVMKQVVMGILAMVVGGASHVAIAQPAPRAEAKHRDGEAMLSLNSGDLNVMLTVARNAFQLRLRVPGDTVSFTADANGNVSVHRGTQVLRFSVRHYYGGEQAQMRDLLARSTAWRSFDSLMRTSWGTSSRPGLAFRPAHSMVWLLHGDYRPLLAFASGNASPAPAMRLVRNDCDRAYARRVGEIYDELVSCLDTWNPLQTAWCAYEYNFKATWALFEYQACLI
jgi:hypothetical protein